MNGYIGDVGEIKVMVSNMLPLFKSVQFRFPKTKRKRLVKKWSKNTSNFKQVENNDGYMVGDTFICNQRVADAIKSTGSIQCK